MDVTDIDEERLETGTLPSPTWGRANPAQRWAYIGIGAGAVLAVEVAALFVWGVTLL